MDAVELELDDRRGMEKQSCNSGRLRILTDHDKDRHPAWMGRVDVFRELWEEHACMKAKRPSALTMLARQLLWTWRLYRRSRDYDVVLTGSDRIGLFFAAGQRLFRRKRVPHIFINFMVNVQPNSSTLRKVLYRLAVEGAGRVMLMRRCERALYADVLRVSADKFVVAPYHSTLYDTRYEARNNGYIFAGGDSQRDYRVLLQAVSDLPYPVVIAALSKEHFRGIDVPSNVKIVSVTSTEFIDLMAGAALVVVPLKPMPQHVGGQQTYENAMTMGKPTIVTDPGASDYIDDNVTGILTPPGDVSSLRNAIVRLMENPDLSNEMGRNAREAARKMSPERFFEEVFRLCEELGNRERMRRVKSVG